MHSKESHNSIEELKKVHLDAGKKTFTPEADINHFHPEERELLFEYGSWMQALAKGNIEPYTEAQAHFIKVAKGLLAPTNEFENIWIKYQHRVIWEENNGNCHWSDRKNSKTSVNIYDFFKLKK